MTSLEGVWRTGVRAVELETLLLVSSRGYPLLTMVNGPLKPGFDIIRWAWRPGIAYDLGSEPWRAAGVCL